MRMTFGPVLAVLALCAGMPEVQAAQPSPQPPSPRHVAAKPTRPPATNAQKQAQKEAKQAAQKAIQFDARLAELDRFERMGPLQRERVLSNLPPARRERIEQGMAELKNNPQARQRLRQFQSMSPEDQKAMRDNFRRLQELPQERRVAVRQEMVRLRMMTPEQREKHLQSAGFRKRFDEGEQGLLGDMASSLPPQ